MKRISQTQTQAKMSLKVLLVLCLVAAASASPTPTGSFIADVLHVKESALGNSIGFLFRSVVGAKHVARNILSDILNLKVRGFSEVIELGVKVCLGLGDVVDASITGLGNLVSRIVACTLKIIVCFLGNGGNKAICRNDWNTQFGVQATAAANIQALIRLYGLADCKSKVQTLIDVYTRGRGIAKVNGSLRIVLQVALDLANRLHIVIDGSGSLKKSDLTFCYRKIAVLLGVIGNSHKKGQGLQIVNNFIPTCNKHIVIAGYPGFGDWNDVKVEINFGNDDNAPWAITDVDAQANTGVSGSVGLGQIIGGILRGVIGIKRLAANLIEDIVKIALNTFEDVITLSVKIVLGLGGLLDATIAGLGSLLVRIVAALLKIVLCFVGGNGKYGVCRRGWNSQFGISGEADSIEGIIQLYGIGNCNSDVNQYINTYTHGKGIASATGSVKILLQSSLTLSQLVQSRKFEKSTLVVVFTHLTYLLGSVGNSNSKGVGTDVCNRFIPACNKFLTAEGYEGYGNSQQDIINIIQRANGDNYIWSADIDDDVNKHTGFIVGAGVSGSGSVSVGGSGGLSIGGLLGGIFRGIRGVTRLASNVLIDILNIKINALVDVFNLFVKLSLGVGGAIDNKIHGLGSLFSRIIAVILKIGVCVKGFPGDRSICNHGWNAQFGIKGEASTASDLIVLFRLNKAQSEVDNCIKTYTKGQGISSVKSQSVRIILEKCSSLSVYITNYNQISKDTITNSFVTLTTISAAIANANKKDSGKLITQQVIQKCGKVFQDQGYPDITQEQSRIDTVIVHANGDNVTWTEDNDNSGNNAGNNNNGSNNNGNNDNNTTGDNNTSEGTNNAGNNNTTGDNNTAENNNNNNGDNNTTGGNNTSEGSNNAGDNNNTGDNHTNGDNNTAGNNNGNNNSGDNNTTGDNNTSEGSNNAGDNNNTGDNNTAGNNNGNNNNNGDNNTTGDNNTSEGSNNAGDNNNTGENNTAGNNNNGNNNNGDNNTTGDNNTSEGSNNAGDNNNTGDNTTTGDNNTAGNNNNGNNNNNNGDNNTTGNNNTSEGSNNAGDNNTTGDNTTGDDNTSGNNENNGGNTGNNNNGGSNTVGGSGSVSVGVDLGGIIGGALRGVAGVTRLDSNVVTEIVNIKINAFYDVVTLTTRVGLGLGGVIDSAYIGLGSIFARLVAVIFKIGICVNGFPGDKSICNKNWNAQFGVNGDANNAADLIALFRLNDCQSDVEAIVKVNTSGRGISSTTGSINIVLQKIYDLSIIVSSQQITKQHVSTCFVNVFTIFGGICNANRKSSGTDITKKIVPACGRYFVDEGYPDVSSEQQRIYHVIDGANNDNNNWKTGTQVSGSQSTVIVKGNGLVTNVRDLFKGFKDQKNVKQATVTAVLYLDTPRNFGGVLTFGIKVIQALGSIIDVFISGLGSLLVRIVGFILRYVVCVLGGSKHSKHFVCQKAYYNSFGVSVSGNTFAEIAAGFKVTNVKADLDAIVNAYTNNKGRNALSGSPKACVDGGYSLVNIVLKEKKIAEADLTVLFEIITSILGSFANSWSVDFGKQISNSMVPVCSTFLETNGYPALTPSLNKILVNIQGGNKDNAPWAR